MSDAVMADESEPGLDPDKARHFTPRDPRFAAAPMTPAEMKALHQASTSDEAFALLGRMQEERMRDGSIPHTQQPNQWLLLLDQYMPTDEQIRLGMRPTPDQLAQLRQTGTAADEHSATMQFMAERKAQNEQWFELSRRWDRELDRQAGHDDRLRTPRGIQGWRDTSSENVLTDEQRAFAEQLTAAAPAPEAKPARAAPEIAVHAPRETTDRQLARQSAPAARPATDPALTPDRGNER